MRRRVRGLAWGALAAGLLAAGGPVLADVKAGVDAWSRGDFASAVREWREPAAAGDPDAQFNLAQAYRLGRGVAADPAMAEQLYARAAAQGHVRAADNYGLVLFQKGQPAAALPYIRAAAGRGDPRAQYLLGIGHFNGDLVEKDWRRAYALLTLANSAGLPQAAPALAEMDAHVPVADRQAAQTLATQLRAEAEAARVRELGTADLAIASDPAASVPSSPPDHSATVRTVTVATSAPAPARQPAPAQMQGTWKVQLGSFSVPANADRMWSQLSGRRELAGAVKVKRTAGRFTVLQAGGFASKTAAQGACATLKAAGHSCLVVQ